MKKLAKNAVPSCKAHENQAAVCPPSKTFEPTGAGERMTDWNTELVWSSRQSTGLLVQSSFCWCSLPAYPTSRFLLQAALTEIPAAPIFQKGNPSSGDELPDHLEQAAGTLPDTQRFLRRCPATQRLGPRPPRTPL